MSELVQVATNAKRTFVGFALVLVVGLVAVPPTLSRLGTTRFGLLSFAWIIHASGGILDLGLGRAATKFSAEIIHRGRRADVGRVVWSAFAIQAVLGAVVLGCAGLGAGALAGVLDLDAALVDDARLVILLTAAAFPFLLLSSTLAGVLQAAGRFDVWNWIRVPFGMLAFLIPLGGAIAELSLPAIVLLLGLSRAGATVALFAAVVRLFPGAAKPAIDRSLGRRLLSYTGWAAVSSTIIPVLEYVDRFVIGSLVSAGAVSYYAVPYDAVGRLAILPGSLATSLFPVFSADEGPDRRGEIAQLYRRSIKVLLVITALVAIPGIILADDLLTLWIDADFAERSTFVLQVLLAHLVVNAIAYVPLTLLQARGRVDLPAKFHLWEVVPYLVLLYVLTDAFGVEGTAVAWLARGTADAGLLLLGGARLSGPGSRGRSGAALGLGLAGLAVGSLVLVRWVVSDPLARVALGTLLTVALCVPLYVRVLDDFDRGFVRSLIRR